jgi:hypothetical protein
MSWNYSEPDRDEFSTDEEYEEALRAYESAEDDYCQDYEEEMMASRG